MTIILNHDLENLGYQYDIVNVKPGYARNFLIPKGYAVAATDANIRMRNETVKQKEFKEKKLIKEAQATADALKNTKINLGAKISSKGNIFGSITTIQLAEAIKKKGINVERKWLTLDKESIKSAGKYTANVKLHKEVAIDFEFEVVAE